MRASLVAVIAVVCALLGGAGALVVGKAAGWIDGDGETVVLREAGAATPASQVEQGATGDESKPLPGNDFDPTEIYAERAAGVVTVQSLFEGEEDAAEGGVAQGSGFVVSDDGYILTNSHVITTAGEAAGTANAAAASQVYVEFKDGDRLTARIVGWDVYDDVGLLKVEPGDHTLRPLPLGDSSEVEVGEPVVAIGSPFGQTSTMTAGIVGATERSIDSLTSEYSLVDAIQTDAPINRGNSGGPLFDARGLVIGINAQIRSESGTAEGVGFAVPINSAVRTMEQLKETGEVRYAWVGITTQSVTPTLDRRFDFGTERGAAVQSIVPGSPAEASDLEAGEREVEFGGVPIRPGGDVIVAIDDEPVEDAEDVVRAVTQRLPGETARFTVVRDGERVVVRVKLGERPANPPDNR